MNLVQNILPMPSVKKFDLVTFNKVLEHVEDHIFFLKKSIKLLKKNLIYVEVPSVSAMNDKQGKEREELHLTHHHVFSKQSLENIFQFSKIRQLQKFQRWGTVRVCILFFIFVFWQ